LNNPASINTENTTANVPAQANQNQFLDLAKPKPIQRSTEIVPSTNIPNTIPFSSKLCKYL
jgi:hypothetical protein